VAAGDRVGMRGSAEFAEVSRGAEAPTVTETRIGRRFVRIEPAKALAKLHLGRVIDLDSRREVANYA
jgi:hypothetical protein